MTIIELLKQLAEKYPEKWAWNGFNESLYMIDHSLCGPRLRIHDYSTEDCDRILAEHGLVMWVVPHINYKWFGQFERINPPSVNTMDPNNHPTKRAATEATFQSALEYILREGK
jgi:hypothetical protein